MSGAGATIRRFPDDRDPRKEAPIPIPDAPDVAPDPAPHLPESTEVPLYDALLPHWHRIAATAWLGFRRHGRGAVCLRGPTAFPLAIYRPGAPCECHAELVVEYDPATQAVVAVHDDDGDVVFAAIVDGWPAPPDAWTTFPDTLAGERAH